MAAIGFPGCVASLVGALQGSQTPSGNDRLWIATFVFLGMGIVGAIGWWLTRDDDRKQPTVSTIQDAGHDAFNAGRDQTIVGAQHNYYAPTVPQSSSVPRSASDHVKQLVDDMNDRELRRVIGELTAFTTEAAKIAEHPGNGPIISWLGGEETEHERQQRVRRAEYEELRAKWTANVRAKLEADAAEFLADWDAAAPHERLAALRDIIKELRAKLR